jgi:hypothetical protein
VAQGGRLAGIALRIDRLIENLAFLFVFANEMDVRVLEVVLSR